MLDKDSKGKYKKAKIGVGCRVIFETVFYDGEMKSCIVSVTDPHGEKYFYWEPGQTGKDIKATPVEFLAIFAGALGLEYTGSPTYISREKYKDKFYYLLLPFKPQNSKKSCQ